VPAEKKCAPDATRLQSIEGVLFDCDGVLTPGDLIFDERGGRLLRFHARDGVGLAIFCKRVGLKAGILSGRPTDIAEKRFAELGVQSFMGGSRNKYEDALKMCEALDIAPENTAFVGDDIPDLAAFRALGLGVAVNDAADEVKEAADWILQTRGGYGAAREICEAILRARGDWQTSAEA
jgi:YrbI family 3-deoxy-D-manno-octulosonate 8-phosphate phosphatase